LRGLYLNRVKSDGSCQALTETGFWGFGVRRPGLGFGDLGFGICREPTIGSPFSSAKHELRTPNPTNFPSSGVSRRVPRVGSLWLGCRLAVKDAGRPLRVMPGE